MDGLKLKNSSPPQPIQPSNDQNEIFKLIQVYDNEVNSLLQSAEFANANRVQKKQIVGNTIYKHVQKIVGDELAPKITGMIIDLPEPGLQKSISQWKNFYSKVQAAYMLIQREGNQSDVGAEPHN